MSNLEPVWTLRIQQWWEGLLGPGLTQAWSAVKKTGSAPSLLTKAHGATVSAFASELKALGQDARAFAAGAEGTVWAPFAEKSLEVHGRILDRWQDPQATQPAGGVEGLLDPVATVMRIGNTAVTAIGMAWAVASLAHVMHARRTLKRWREHLAGGVDPSRRDTRRAGIEGVVFDDVELVAGDLVGFRRRNGPLRRWMASRRRRAGPKGRRVGPRGRGPAPRPKDYGAAEAAPPPPSPVPVSGVELGCEDGACVLDEGLLPGEDLAYRANDAIPAYALDSSLAYRDGSASLGW